MIDQLTMYFSFPFVRYASHILHLSNVPRFFGTKSEYIKTDIGKSFADAAGGEAK